MGARVVDGELEQRRRRGRESGGGEAERAEGGGARAEAERLSAGEAMRTVHQGFEHSMAAIGASRGDARDLPAAEKMGMSFVSMRSMLRRIALLLALLPLVAACGSGAAGGGSDAPTIVATTTQLADMARNIAPGAHVTSLLTPNTDPHEYEVRPNDVKALASADIVLRSGGEVDEWLDGALDSAGVDEQDVVDAGAAAGLEGDDPHWWQDPRRAEKAAVAIGAAFAGAGLPDDSAAYVKRLQALDAGVQGVHRQGAGRRSASSSRATTRSATTRAATASR